ncbi:hypothetical protein [Planomonospora parontospora]|uniref:hypothetical protein n=1 Tax=Planomonospora parontospora TaxID=58119 RepID=UPI0016713891|nr:hypothetical protein [Planomonospora parontospora]GGL08457.1 hypothetical protein GCM10014719_08120 [Planomonospora parontospora subsp. antibiotica]GII14533.1 hypothetical protein Ppa05_12590 [Planomonospora parontospora subsp. antibiotica]
MADADGTSSGRPRDRRIPSYEAPTTPMPVVRPDGDPVVTPRVPRRPRERADVQVSGPGRSGPDPAGPAKAASGGGESGDASGSGDGARRFRVGAPPGGRVLRRGLWARIADIPIRLVYSAGAAVVTVLAILSVFALFSGDEPADPVPLRRPVPGAAPTAASAPPSASPATVPPRLPVPPRSKPLAALPGRASPVVGAVVDQESGITYVRLGQPWADGPVPPFTAGRRVGGARLPRTMAVSLPLPGRTPWTGPRTDAGFRAAALGAVRWALRNHYPPGARVEWTASQRPAAGRGWVLGYRVDYELGGARRSSQAALALLETRRAEPAVLLVTVPDGRKRLWADIAPLVRSARAL